MVHSLTSQDFSAVVKSADWVIVDFWAPWCAPCRRMESLFEQAAQTFAGRVTFAKVDIDACKDIANEYNVLSIPTFILFHKGEPFARQVGSMQGDALAQWISGHLPDRVSV